MVVGTVAGVATIIAAAPAVAVAVGVGSVATATAGGTAAVAAAAAGGTATAVGGTAGAITGVAATVGSTATAVLESFAVPLASAGPTGWITLGFTQDRSWDCWKPVVHDTSTTPSKGRLLREMISDERIKESRIDENGQLFLLNIWNELFRIDYVTVDDQLAAHATRC